MIDEKKLIESFEKAKDYLARDKYGRQTISVDTIIYLLENAEKVGEWISVSERLPDVDIEVLVSCKARITKYSYIDIDYRSKKNGKWAYLGEDVIAWQPLPESFKGE